MYLLLTYPVGYERGGVVMVKGVELWLFRSMDTLREKTE